MNKTLWLSNLKTRTAMNAKTTVFAICVEVIIYWLFYNLHDCTFIVFMSMRSLRRFFVNFEQITQLVLEFPLLTLSRQIPTGYILIFAFVYVYFASIFTLQQKYRVLIGFFNVIQA